MGIALGQVGGQILGNLVNEGMGLLFGQTNNTMQQANQQVLTNQQLQANEQLSQFNFAQQMNMWNATNYPAQVAQLQKAGLNPALLYAKGGMGGMTGQPTTGAGMGQAPGTPIPQPGMAMNLASAAADVELKKAQAENIRAQTPQEAPLMQAQIDTITQGIQNQKAEQALTQIKTQAQELQNQITGKTIDDQIATIRAAATNMESIAQMAVRNNYMDQNTMNDKMQTIRGIMIQTFLQNANIQSQTKLNNQQITQIVNQIQQNWKQLDINQQNVNINNLQKNINQQDANTREYTYNLQKFVNDLPMSDQFEREAIMKLIPNIGVGAGGSFKIGDAIKRNPIGFQY